MNSFDVKSQLVAAEASIAALEQDKFELILMLKEKDDKIAELLEDLPGRYRTVREANNELESKRLERMEALEEENRQLHDKIIQLSQETYQWKNKALQLETDLHAKIGKLQELEANLIQVTSEKKGLEQARNGLCESLEREKQRTLELDHDLLVAKAALEKMAGFDRQNSGGDRWKLDKAAAIDGGRQGEDLDVVMTHAPRSVSILHDDLVSYKRNGIFEVEENPNVVVEEHHDADDAAAARSNGVHEAMQDEDMYKELIEQLQDRLVIERQRHVEQENSSMRVIAEHLTARQKSEDAEEKAQTEVKLLVEKIESLEVELRSQQQESECARCLVLEKQLALMPSFKADSNKNDDANDNDNDNGNKNGKNGNNNNNNNDNDTHQSEAWISCAAMFELREKEMQQTNQKQIQQLKQQFAADRTDLINKINRLRKSNADLLERLEQSQTPKSNDPYDYRSDSNGNYGNDTGPAMAMAFAQQPSQFQHLRNQQNCNDQPHSNNNNNINDNHTSRSESDSLRFQKLLADAVAALDLERSKRERAEAMLEEEQYENSRLGKLVAEAAKALEIERARSKKSYGGTRSSGLRPVPEHEEMHDCKYIESMLDQERQEVERLTALLSEAANQFESERAISSQEIEKLQSTIAAIKQQQHLDMFSAPPPSRSRTAMVDQQVQIDPNFDYNSNGSSSSSKDRNVREEDNDSEQRMRKYSSINNSNDTDGDDDSDENNAANDSRSLHTGALVVQTEQVLQSEQREREMLMSLLEQTSNALAVERQRVEILEENLQKERNRFNDADSKIIAEDHSNATGSPSCLDTTTVSSADVAALKKAVWDAITSNALAEISPTTSPIKNMLTGSGMDTPVPQLIHGLHHSVNSMTAALMDAHKEMAKTLPLLEQRSRECSQLRSALHLANKRVEAAVGNWREAKESVLREKQQSRKRLEEAQQLVVTALKESSNSSNNGLNSIGSSSGSSYSSHSMNSLQLSALVSSPNGSNFPTPKNKDMVIAL